MTRALEDFMKLQQRLERLQDIGGIQKQLTQAMSIDKHMSPMRAIIDQVSQPAALDVGNYARLAGADIVSNAVRLKDALGPALSAAALAGSPINDLNATMRALGSPWPDYASSYVGHEASRLQQALRLVTGGEHDLLTRGIAAPAFLDAMRQSPAYDLAQRAAERAAAFALPDVFAPHRPDIQSLADRLAIGSALGQVTSARWADPEYLNAFGVASAASSLLSRDAAVGHDAFQAVSAISESARGWNASLTEYRGVLDTAGLLLPRWPRVRLFTDKEKALRQRRCLNRLTPPRHVKRAMTLVHQHERYLRDIIDASMTAEYGEDWADERLPLCGQNGRSLMKKASKEGLAPLECADYAHYEAIIAHPDHFAAVFAAGFTSPDDVRDLIGRTRNLRAASHHAREFTPADLAALRSTWRAILKAFRCVEDEVVVLWEG